MHINSSPLNFPMVLVAAASILGAIYTSAPAQARDLVGAPVAANAQAAEGSSGKTANNRKPTRLAKAQTTDVSEAVAYSMLASQGGDTEAARRAEFARRLFWVMLSMR